MTILMPDVLLYVQVSVLVNEGVTSERVRVISVKYTPVGPVTSLILDGGRGPSTWIHLQQSTSSTKLLYLAVKLDKTACRMMYLLELH